MFKDMGGADERMKGKTINSNNKNERVMMIMRMIE